MSVTVSRSRLSVLNYKQRIALWATSTRRRYKEAWDIFSRNRLALLGVLLIVVFALMAIAHPILMRTVWQKYIYDPYTGYDLEIFSHPSLPSTRHLLGTDTLGRDVFSILLAATTPTFVMAIAAAMVTAVVGTLAGAASAYFRGFVDSFLTHLADLCLLVPAPLVMVVIGFVLDITPLQFGVLYGLLSGLGGVSIIMRAYALPIMTKPYVDAARVAGGTNLHIIFKHILPQMLPMTVVNMMLTVTGAVFASGFVAF